MKIYRSLIYREIKILRRQYLFPLLVILAVSAVMLVPVLRSPTKNGPLYLYFMSLIYSAVGGFLAGFYSTVSKEDKASGWKKYSHVLPVTARQKALTNLLVKLIFMILIAGIVAAYAVIGGIITGRCFILPVMNMYLASAAAALIMNILFDVMPMTVKSETAQSVLLLSAVGLIMVVYLGLKVVFRNSDYNKLMNAIAASLSSVGMLIKALLVLAVLCLLYYIGMKEAHRSREP